MHSATRLVVVLAAALVTAVSAGVVGTTATDRIRVPPPSLWNRTGWVDTRIGSGGGGWGIGDLNPGPQVPFGAMRLGPDTSIGFEPFRLTFDDMAGYYYFNNHIECLSHTHVVGAGEGDFQNFGVIVTRALNDNIIQDCNYRSQYTHEQEVAKPGYYAVNLLTPNVYAEVAVSGTHAGIHRYTARQTYPEPLGPSFLLIDVCHGVTRSFGDMHVNDSCIRASLLNITASADQMSFEVDAWVFNKGSFSQSSNRGGIDIYFHAVVSAFDIDPASGSMSPIPLNMSTWEGNVVRPGVWEPNSTTTTGSLGVAFTPAGESSSTTVTQYIVKTAISFVSSSNARLNFAAQGAATLEEAVKVNIAMWEEHQSSVQYSGGAADTDWHRVVFETALYHVALPPTTYSESNGQYMGEDWNVHTVAEGARYLSDLSIWDIYRTQAPLLLWVKPSVAVDLTNSMMEMYRETGALPVWVFANIETYCMVGHHSAIILTDYILKGLPNINTSAILEAVMSQIALQNTANLAQYGFVAVETEQLGASLTLDYSIDSGAAANMAKFLNATDAAATALLNAFGQSYRNTWDNTTSFFCPRHANGTFACDDPYNPYPFERMYTEGNAAEYRWYVPHDIDGLMGMFPNRTYFVDQLDEFFSLSTLWPLNTTLPNPAFWAGNEPDILAPFLFLFAGNEYAYLTSYWIPQILERYYYPWASGIPGNDDYGTMSAWVVFAYMGIYPVASTDLYGLFAPQFDAIDVTLSAAELAQSPWRDVVRQNATPGARTTIVRIRATGRPATGTAYVASIVLNGVQLERPIVQHRDLVALGNESSTLIEFVLTDEPTVFGAASPSRGGGGGPAPYTPASRLWTPAEASMKQARMDEYAARSLKEVKATPAHLLKQSKRPRNARRI